MKKFKKIVALCLAAATLLMSGCSKGGEKEDNGKTHITMWTAITESTPESEVKLQEMLEARLAEKFPDIEVEFINRLAGKDYREEYDKAMMAKEEPTIYHMFSYTDIPTRIEKGTIADITKLVDGWQLKKEGKVIETFDNVINKGDKWYAIPRSAYTKGLLVSKKALENSGIDSGADPRTWEEFTQICSQATNREDAKIGYALFGNDACVWSFIPWVWSAGGDFVEETKDGKYNLLVDADPVVDAAYYMNRLIWEHKATQTNIIEERNELYKLLYSGSAVYAFGDLYPIKDTTLSKYGLTPEDFDFTTYPTKDESVDEVSFAGGEVITFSPRASDEELQAAFKVAEYIYYDEEWLAEKWAFENENSIREFSIPARSDLYEAKLNSYDSISDGFKKALLTVGEASMPEPACPYWTEFKTKFEIPLQKVYADEDITRDEVKKIFEDFKNEFTKSHSDAYITE